jgi:hypothetical protein
VKAAAEVVATESQTMVRLPPTAGFVAGGSSSINPAPKSMSSRSRPACFKALGTSAEQTSVFFMDAPLGSLSP